MPPVTIDFPLGGMVRRLAYQQQGPFTSPDLVNVLDRDPLTGRLRGGSRPGQLKALSTQIGSGNPIRLGALCRSLTATSIRAFTDAFTASMATDWEFGNWGAASLPTVSGGSAVSSSASKQAALVKASTAAINTAVYRAVSATITVAGSISNTTAIRLLLDTRTTAAGDTEGIEAEIKFSSTTGRWHFSLHIDGTQNVAVGTGSVISPTGQWFKLEISPSKIITVSYDNSAVLTYNASAYTPTQAQPGIEFHEVGAAAVLSAGDFRVDYTATGANKPPLMMVASSNGRLYYEATDGTWAEATYGSGPPNLPSDRLLSAAMYLQKLYIADHGVITSGTGATTTGTTTITLDDNAKNFTTLGLIAGEHRVEILSGTGIATTGRGIFEIASVSPGADTTRFTFTNDSGLDLEGTNIAYRVCRVPKVFDGATATMSKVPIGTVGGGDGQFPLNCSLIAAGMGRLFWGGDIDNPHFAFASKKGDEENYRYGQTPIETSAFAWDPARTDGSQSIGDVLTALIPHRDDYFVFGCRNSCFVLRGDPGLGGELDIITPQFGVIGAKAVCQLPDGTLSMMTTAGLYRVPPSAEAVPVPVSPLVLPQELRAIDTAFSASAPTSGSDVQLEYDVERSLVVLCVTPRAIGTTKHWLHRPGSLEDVEGLLQYGGSFWPWTGPPTMDPTALVPYTPSGGTQTVCLMGRDGYARVFNDGADDDDGTDFAWYVLYGPIMLSGSDYLDGMLEEVIVQTARNSATVTVAIQVGVSAEAAFNAVPETLGTVAANTKRTFPIRRRGNAVIIRISRTEGGIASLETLQIYRSPLGKQRVG